MLSRFLFRLLGGLSAGLLVACHANAPTDEAAGPPPRAQVQAVTVATQSLTQYRTFPATSTYPRKSTVTAPVAAYVTGVRVRLGDRVVLMSSRPGRVAKQYPVEIAHPRRIESPEVATLSVDITDDLRTEIRRHGAH